MSGDAWQVVQVGVTAAAMLVVAWRSTRKAAPEGRSASAAEVEALGKRLDAQAERIGQLEKTNRALYAYIATDHGVHLSQGWPITPLPQEIA